MRQVRYFGRLRPSNLFCLHGLHIGTYIKLRLFCAFVALAFQTKPSARARQATSKVRMTSKKGPSHASAVSLSLQIRHSPQLDLFERGSFRVHQLRAVLLSIVVAGAVVVLAFVGASVDALILSC